MAVNSIGIRTFVFLLGEVPVIQQDIGVLVKPGEDGHRRRRMGLRSTDFTLESHQTFATDAAAREALILYADLLEGTAQELIQDDYNFETSVAAPEDAVKVAVLHVEPIETRLTSCNTTGSPWLLRCEWTLRLVPVPVP